MCELLVGLPDIDVIGVADPAPGRLVVVVAAREDRPVCGRCATAAWVKDRREVDLVDLPAFDQTVTLRVVRTRWRCPRFRCGVGSWTLEHPDIAPAGHRLTTRAGRWACEQVGRWGRSVAEVADALGCDWHRQRRRDRLRRSAPRRRHRPDRDGAGVVVGRDLVRPRRPVADPAVVDPDGRRPLRAAPRRGRRAHRGRPRPLARSPRPDLAGPDPVGRSWTCPAPIGPRSTPCSRTPCRSPTRSTS